MKDIIIIRHEPLNKHTQEIYMIDELTARGFKVFYWDLSPLCFPGMVLHHEVQVENSLKIPALASLNEQLQNTEINNAVFIVDVFENWANRKIFKLLKDHACFSVRIDLFADSILPIPKWKYFNFTWFDVTNFFGKATKKISYSLYKRKYNLDPYQLYLTTAPDTVTPRHKAVAINHPDYIKSLLPATQPLVDGKYAVFLDEFFPFHPDLEHMLGIKSNAIEAQAYLDQLNRFFSYVETSLGLEVVIAAHPKSNYDKAAFSNRKVFIYKTRELVYDAELVLAQGSSSINYAVLFEKAIVFLYTNTYYRRYRYLYLTTAYHATILNSPLFNIEQALPLALSPTVDDDAYYNYKYSKLTSRTCERQSNSEILEQVISNI